MQANYVQRLRLTFRKFGPTRYIGHLDLARTLERSLNRAQIPVAYTQGFNKRPRMQMAAALPLGYTSDAELADIWLTESVVPESTRQQMMERMAPGLEVLQVEEIPLSAPALQTVTDESVYAVSLLDPVSLEALQERIDELLAAESLLRERGHGRKRKRYDLRPLINKLALDQDETGEISLTMRLSLQPSKTGRPDEVLRALDLDPMTARIRRTAIILQPEGVA